MSLFFCYHPTPVGRFLLAGTDRELRYTSFVSGKRPKKIESSWKEDIAPLGYAIEQIDAYFAGELRDFDIPFHAEGTPFQQAVWSILEVIPFGDTMTYGAVAEKLGRSGGAQAVGAACGANPLPIIVPCHRVIGANGSMTGFGGGLPIKHQLLELEGISTMEEQLPLDFD